MANLLLIGHEEDCQVEIVALFLPTKAAGNLAHVVFDHRLTGRTHSLRADRGCFRGDLDFTAGVQE